MPAESLQKLMIDSVSKVTINGDLISASQLIAFVVLLLVSTFLNFDEAILVTPCIYFCLSARLCKFRICTHDIDRSDGNACTLN